MPSSSRDIFAIAADTKRSQLPGGCLRWPDTAHQQSRRRRQLAWREASCRSRTLASRPRAVTFHHDIGHISPTAGLQAADSHCTRHRPASGSYPSGRQYDSRIPDKWQNSQAEVVAGPIEPRPEGRSRGPYRKQTTGRRDTVRGPQMYEDTNTG